MKNQNRFPFLTANRLFSQNRMLIILAALTIAIPAVSKAANDTWNGSGTNGRWSTAANWTGGAPSSGAATSLVFDGTVRLSATNNGQVSEINSITFNPGAGAFVLSGSALQIDGGGITNNSTNTQTISFSGTSTLGSFQIWNAASGNILVTSKVNLNGNGLDIVGPNNVTISGNISGSGGALILPISVGKADGTSGNLTLSGNNTFGTDEFGNGVLLQSGTLTVNSNNALSSGTLMIANSGATGVTLGSGSAGINIGNTLDVLSSFSVAPSTAVASGTLTVSGQIILDTTSGTTAFTITATNGNVFRMTGGISQSGSTSASLTYDGGGSAVNGIFRVGDTSTASTYTGLTTVTDKATLLLNNTGDSAAIPGNLQIDNGSAVKLVGNDEEISNSATVTVDGSFVLSNHTETINDLEGASTGVVTIGTGTFIVSTGSYSGIIKGAVGGAFVKNGPGTLTLYGASTYNAQTDVNSGVLQAGAATVFSNNSAYVLSSTGTLDLNGFNNSVGSLASGTAGGGIVTNNGTANAALTTGADGTSTNFNGTLEDGARKLGLTKVGSGTLTLSGTDNTYSGRTTVSAGTLLAGSGLGSGSGGFNHAFSSNSNVTVKGTGTLDLGGFSNEIGSLSDGGVNTGIVQNSGTSKAMLGIGATNASGTFSGLIQDGGAPLELIKLGTGAQTLSGSNTYSGGTALEAGTLFVDNDDALGSGTLAITGGTFSTHLQSGSLVLNNNMLVQGNFFIAPPALGDGIRLDGAMDLGGAVRTITDTVSEGVIEFGGVISDGGITLSSTGSPAYISFNGISANTYTGLTTVNDNVILLLQANGNVPGDLMITPGAVVWDTAGNLLSATSSVMVNSTGTTSLFGTLGGLDIGGNNETIGALFGTGNVQLNDGNINGSSATKAGILTVSSGSFSGVISDGSFGGQLVKTGTGILSLTGTSTYTGKTTVNAGLLQVNGSIASGTTIVNAGGTLGGVGTIGGNVFNGGFVAPGDAPGTLTIAGNYSQITAGTLVIQIGGLGAGQHDLLAVGGSAALSGTLQLVRLNNFQPKSGTSLTILTAAGGVTGQFSSVDTDTIMYVKVVYQPDDVVLDFGQKSFAGLPGLTPNQFAVARNLDFAVIDPRNAALNAFLTGELLGNLPHDFDLISPEQLTSIFGISFSFADVQAGNIENRLAEIRAENTPSTNVGVSVTTAGYTKDDDKKTVSTPSAETPRWNLFMEGNGEFVHVNGDTNAAGYNFTTGGVTVGADYRVCDHFTLGIMGGYADTGATLTQGGAVDVNSGRVGIYSTTYGNGFYLNTLAAGGYNSYDTHRTGLGGIAQGNTDGAEFDGLISTGYDLHSGNFTVGPIASAQYTYVGINNFNETGSLAPLTIPSQNQESFRSKVGFKVSSLCHVGGIVVTPTVSAAWQHEYLDSTYALDSSFASGAGNVFTVTGPALGRDSVVVNAGVNVEWTPRFSTYLYYDGELGRKNYELNSVSGGLQFKY